MVDIVGINTTTQQTNRVSSRATAKSEAAKAPEAKSTASSGDRIDISAGVQQMQSVKRLVAAAQAEPDYRPEAVSRAKERLDNGEYEGVEVSRQTARKILGL